MKRALTIALLLAAAIGCSWSRPCAASRGRARAGRAAPERIVSLIPAVTEMMFAMGDGARVVGRQQLRSLSRRGRRVCRGSAGCSIRTSSAFSRIKPDLVIVYATQNELIERLDRAAIPYFSYQHRGLADIMTTIRALGARIGSAARAEAVAARDGSSARRDSRQDRRSAAAGDAAGVRARSGSLRNVYASGGYGFLHDMLEIAGGRNVFADMKQQAVQASTEMLLTQQARSDRRAALRRQPEERRPRQRAAASGTRWRRFPRSARTACPRSPATNSSFPGRASSRRHSKLARVIHPDVVAMKTLVSWSSGKDSAWMVHTLRQRGDVEIGALLTTINEPAQRVAMHAVRVEVLQAQAQALGVPLWLVPIPSPCPNEVYEAAMREAVARAVGEGFTHAAFGDLFLEDIRALPRRAPRRHRPDADVSAVRHRRRHAGAGARDDRRRPARADHLPEPRDDRSGIRRPRVRRGAARRAAFVDRPVRRARRIPHLRLRRPDVQPSRSPSRPASRSSATATSSPI